MPSNIMTKPFILLITLLIPGVTHATTTSATVIEQKNIKYVGDTLTIMIRSGQSNKHKIVRPIKSGNQVEVLETSGKYSHVRTRSGVEGWVLSRFLVDQPIAKHRLEKSKKQLSKLTTENKNLNRELLELKTTHASLSQAHKRLDNQAKELTDQNTRIRAVAAEPLKISEHNGTLTKKNISLETANDMLKQEVQTLRDDSDKQWFLMGSGTILLGMLIGFLLSKLRRRRKSDWDKF